MAQSLEAEWDPDVSTEESLGKTMRGWRRSQREYRGALKSALPDPPKYLDAAKEAYKLASERLAGQPPEVIKAAALEVAKRHVARQNRESWSKKEAIGEAIQQGAAALPETVEYTESQQLAQRLGLPWKRTNLQAQHELMREQSDPQEALRVQLDRLTPEERARVQQIQNEEIVGAPREKLGTIANIFQRMAFIPGGFAGMAAEETRQAGDLRPAPGEKTSSLIPVSKLNQPGLEDDWEKLKAFGRGALQTIVDPNAAPRISEEFEKRAARVRQQTFQEASQQLGRPITDEAVQKLGEELYQRRLEGERNPLARFAVEHPVATGFAAEFLDPVGNVVAEKAMGPVLRGAGQLIGKATEKAVETPLGQELAKTSTGRLISNLKAGFTHMPEASEIERGLQKANKAELGKAVGEQLRASDDFALHKAREFQEQFATKVGELEKEIAKQGIDKEAFFRLLTVKGVTRGQLATLPPKYQRAIELNNELADLKQGYDELTGLSREWRSMPQRRFKIKGQPTTELPSGTERKFTLPPKREVLAERARRDVYVPTGMKLEQEAGSIFPTELGGFTSQTSSTTRARKTHGANSVPDVIEQWRHWAKSDLQKAHASLQMRLTHEVLERNNVATRVRIKGDMPVDAREKLELTAKAMGNMFGQKFVVAPVKGIEDYVHGAPSQVTKGQGVGDILTRLSGKGVGKARRLDEVIIAPESAVKMWEATRPFIEASAKKGGSIEEVLDGVNRVISPYMRVWRAANTYIRAPAFVARNVITSAGFSHLALGNEAANPWLHGAALASAYVVADSGPQALGRLGKAVNQYGVKIEDAVRAALDHGLLSQAGAAVGGAVGPAGWADKAAGAIEKFADARYIEQAAGKLGLRPVGAGVRRVVSPSLHAKASENYQRLVPFLGFIRGTSPAEIARAVEFTSKFAGNYNRLGKFERGIVNNTVGFYGWNRWVFPHVVKQLVEHPERVRKWVQARGGLEQYLSTRAWTDLGKPTMPGAMGTDPKHQPKLGSHEFAISMMDDPVQAGLAMVDVIRAAYGKRAIDDDRLIEIASPLTQMVVEMLSGYDMQTGQDLPALDFSSLQGFTSSSIGKVVAAPLLGPGRPLWDLAELFHAAGQPQKEASLKLRMAVGRNWLGLDHYLFPLFGREGMSVGGPLDFTESGGTPGLWMYRHAPYEAGARRKMKALDQWGTRAGRYMRAPVPDRFYRGAEDFYSETDDLDDESEDTGE
jgi:hypothetical protein